MCKLKNLIALLLIIMSFIGGYSFASDNNIPVRVGISDTDFRNYIFDNIEFYNAKDLNVIDSATGYSLPIESNSEKIKVIVENNLFRIFIDDELRARNLTGPILIFPKDKDNLIGISNLKRKGKPALYRGSIELVKSSKNPSKFSVVNVLSLYNYLRGVVPNEMPVKFGLEALKAQTVAARNYAITPRVKAYKEFDLCDSVACQVYFGANTEEKLSDMAVEQTNGIIATDNKNNPILALYSSTAGGYTERYEFAFSDPVTKKFPSKNLEYLSAIPDNPDFEKLNTNEKAEKFYTSNPESFDDKSPYYRWSKEWTADELEQILAKSVYDQSKTGFVKPALTDMKDFGKLVSIQVIERGESGKAVTVEIKTTKNTFYVQKELVIRRCFLKNGISLPSANFVITYIDSEVPVYKISGGGFGHGVGLSQWGSGKMASLGYKYDEILQHYYKGIKLATIPIKLNAYKENFDNFFYTKNMDANVIINNENGVNKLRIIINNKEIDIKLKGKQTIVNISKYLNEGENKISYLILDNIENLSKTLNIYILVKEAEDE